MNASRLFIERPVMTTLVMAAVLLFGLIGLFTLPLNALPNVDFPTLVVTATLPGASPQTMAAAVATPLEKQFSTIAGIESMTSSSAQGQTLVTLQFELSRDIDAAAQDVQAAITAAGRQLPPGMPSPPTYQKVNPANQPVLYLALTSDTLPLSAVDEYAEVYLAQHLSMVGGVAQVQVLGQQKYAVRARVDPRLLASYGVGLDDVAQAMASGNVKLPTGTLFGRHQAWQVQANDQLSGAASFRKLVVAWRNGAPVRLEDLGQVLDSVENDKTAAWVDGRPAILLAVQRQPGTNTVQVVDSLRQALPGLEARIPASARVSVLFDLSQSIRESVRDVELTLVFTVFLVVAVIFLFLGNPSATVIASLALPMSLVGTFAAMSLLGFSLNNLTLMALTLSVGFVVDDAIVVLENIVRHLERGEEPYGAALAGSREIGFTVVSMTLSLVAVFIPVLLMGGILGRLFQEFSVTVSVAILFSGFVSLTLTPMMCSRLLRPPGEASRGAAGWSEGLFEAGRDLYDLTLRLVLRFRALALALSLALMVLTGYLFYACPKGFMPSEDTGQAVGYTEGAQSASFDAMVAHQGQLAEIVRRDPNVATCVSSVGSGGAEPSGNEGLLQVFLKPRGARPISCDQVLEQLAPRLEGIPGIRVYLQNPPSLNVGGLVTKSLYQFTLQSADLELLHRATARLEEELSRLPGLRQVTSDVLDSAPQADVTVDRSKASLLGITADQVDQSLGLAYGARQVSTLFTSSNEYQVLLELDPDFSRSPDQLSRLYLHASTGRLVPLATVARMGVSSAPLLVNHVGQVPSATVSFDLAPGGSLGEALGEVSRVARQVLPPTVTGGFQGTARAFLDSFRGMWALLALSLAIIYLVLGILYESFLHPLTILAGLPSAGLGALLTLGLFHLDLNVYGFLGLVLLIGIVKKNAIMMVDFALEEQRAHGKPPEEAIHSACLVRFRPIMMTTMAALVGSLPIALGWGAGGESRQPLGLAVAGGLLVSQSLTLYLTPVVYLYLDRAVRWGKRLLAGPPGPPPGGQG